MRLLTTYTHKNYFQDIYILKKDTAIEDIILQPDEVVETKWSADADIRKMIENGEFVYSVGQRYLSFASMI